MPVYGYFYVGLMTLAVCLCDIEAINSDYAALTHCFFSVNGMNTHSQYCALSFNEYFVFFSQTYIMMYSYTIVSQSIDYRLIAVSQYLLLFWPTYHGYYPILSVIPTSFIYFSHIFLILEIIPVGWHETNLKL